MEEEAGGGRGESNGGGGIGEKPERDGTDGHSEMEDNNLQEQLDGPEIRKLADVLTEMETATTPGTEEDFRPQ